MQIVLLSGGAGKRLWPLSNDLYSKQFLRLLKRVDGTRESMIQRVCRQVQSVAPDVAITVATAQDQTSLIRRQLGSGVNISIEPCRRDTFPAIALVSAYLHEVRGVTLDEVVAICPADPYVDEDYFRAVRQLSGTWLDIGTWNTLADVMPEHIIGRATLDETCTNVHVVNTLPMPILCMGLKDVVVAAVRREFLFRISIVPVR